MKERNRSIFRKMLPGLGLGFVALVILMFIGDLRQVLHLLANFNWWIFPLALVFTLFNYALRFLKFHYYMGQIGAKGIEWKESLRLFVGGFPLAVTPGKVGEVLKAVWIQQKCGLPVARGVSVVVAERISDGMAVLLLSTLGVIAYPRYWPAFAIVFILLAGIIVVSQVRPAALWLLNLAGRLPLIKRLAGGLREFYEGSYALFRPASTFLAVGLGMVSWLGEGVGFYFILLGLGLSPSIQLLATAVFILSFSTIVGAVSALPGGLGAAEASIAGMLTLLAGIQPATAAAATLLIRLATLWFGVGLGLLVWLVSPELIGLKLENGKTVEG